MDKGSRKAGYAVVTLEGTVETKALPPRASVQKAGLIVSTKALELWQERRVSMHVELRYTFLILYVHGSIWKERGLLTSKKKEIKHAAGVLKLLEAVQVPLQVAGFRKRALKPVKETIWPIEQGKSLLKECL